MVSTPLKNISQNGNLPQIGVKIKNMWNHHLGDLYTSALSTRLLEFVHLTAMQLPCPPFFEPLSLARTKPYTFEEIGMARMARQPFDKRVQSSTLNYWIMKDCRFIKSHIGKIHMPLLKKGSSELLTRLQEKLSICKVVFSYSSNV